MVIALYGGVGSGKTMVSDIIKNKYGAIVLSADKIVHKLYEPDEKGYQIITDLFGDYVLTNGLIDRTKLAEILYKDTERMKEVDDAIHPLVYEKMRECVINNPDSLILIEQAVLPDEIQDYIDYVWFVRTDESVRRDRLKRDRGYTNERIDEIISYQPSYSEFERIADIIINNNGTIKELEETVDENIKYCKRKQRELHLCRVRDN